jgi:hypothetical protein
MMYMMMIMGRRRRIRRRRRRRRIHRKSVRWRYHRMNGMEDAMQSMHI